MAPSPLREPTTAVEALSSFTCRCGLRKDQKGVPFCGACYGSLPRPIRVGLRTHERRVYERAYEAACVILDNGPAGGSYPPHLAELL
jgi:hypothetical protein